jgi:hypothetical protein
MPYSLDSLSLTDPQANSVAPAGAAASRRGAIASALSAKKKPQKREKAALPPSLSLPEECKRQEFSQI